MPRTTLGSLQHRIMTGVTSCPSPRTSLPLSALQASIHTPTLSWNPAYTPEVDENFRVFELIGGIEN